MRFKSCSYTGPTQGTLIPGQNLALQAAQQFAACNKAYSCGHPSSLLQPKILDEYHPDAEISISILRYQGLKCDSEFKLPPKKSATTWKLKASLTFPPYPVNPFLRGKSETLFFEDTRVIHVQPSMRKPAEGLLL